MKLDCRNIAIAQYDMIVINLLLIKFPWLLIEAELINPPY